MTDLPVLSETVTVSPRYQIVIPRAVRERLKLRPGQKVQVVLYRGRVQLVPVMPPEQARGFLAGIDTRVERDEEERAQ